MALNKQHYQNLGTEDALAGNQARRPASGWQYDAYMRAWEFTTDEGAVKKSEVVRVFREQLRKKVADMHRRAEATVKKITRRQHIRSFYVRPAPKKWFIPGHELSHNIRRAA